MVISKTKWLDRALFGTLWVISALPFFVEETAGVAAWSSVNSYVSLAADAMLILLGALCMKKWYDWALLLSLLAMTLYSSLVLNGLGFLFWLNGFRTYVPLVFALPVLRFYAADHERFRHFVRLADRNLYYFLLLQFPCIVIQFLRYGAGDPVGGSLGQGGYSGIVSGILYMGSYYLMRRAWDNRRSFFANLRANWVLLVILFPSFLNETKVSFIYVLLYAVCLLRMDRKFFLRLALSLPVVAALAAGAAYLYISGSGNSDVLEAGYMAEYVMGSDDLIEEMEDAMDVASELDMDIYLDFPRGALYAMLPAVMNDEPYSWQWGFGIGHWKGGTAMKRSAFYDRYEWLMQGTVLQAYTWCVEMGWMGFIWLAVFYYVAFGAYRRKLPGNRDVNLTVFMALFWVIQIFYTAVMFCPTFASMLIYITFMTWHNRGIPHLRMDGIRLNMSERESDTDRQSSPETLPRIASESN